MTENELTTSLVLMGFTIEYGEYPELRFASDIDITHENKDMFASIFGKYPMHLSICNCYIGRFYYSKILSEVIKALEKSDG